MMKEEAMKQHSEWLPLHLQNSAKFYGALDLGKKFYIQMWLFLLFVIELKGVTHADQAHPAVCPRRAQPLPLGPGDQPFAWRTKTASHLGCEWLKCREVLMASDSQTLVTVSPYAKVFIMFFPFTK